MGNQLSPKEKAQEQYIRLMMDSMAEMRENLVHTDVVLCCREVEFNVHKLVLCAGSPYFRAMFHSGMVEAISGRVNLDDLEVKAVAVLVNFLYTGEMIDIPDDTQHIRAVLAATNMLQINILFHHYWKAFTDKLSTKNFVDIWNTAELYDNREMSAHIPIFLADNFVASSSCSDFCMIESHQLKALLSTEGIKKAGSDCIIRGILIWVKHDPNNRKVYLIEMLRLVDIKALTDEFLAIMLNEEDVIKSNVDLLNIFMDTVSCRLLGKKVTTDGQKRSFPRLLLLLFLLEVRP